MDFGTRHLKHPVLFAVIGIVVGIGFGVSTYREWRTHEGIREYGRNTPGTVVEITGKGKKGSKVFVEFEAEGRRVRSEVEGQLGSPNVDVGDTFPIRYDQRRPERDVYDVRATKQGRLVYLGLAASLIALVVPTTIAVVVTRRRRTA